MIQFMRSFARIYVFSLLFSLIFLLRLGAIKIDNLCEKLIRTNGFPFSNQPYEKMYVELLLCTTLLA